MSTSKPKHATAINTRKSSLRPRKISTVQQSTRITRGSHRNRLDYDSDESMLNMQSVEPLAKKLRMSNESQNKSSISTTQSALNLPQDTQQHVLLLSEESSATLQIEDDDKPTTITTSLQNDTISSCNIDCSNSTSIPHGVAMNTCAEIAALDDTSIESSLQETRKSIIDFLEYTNGSGTQYKGIIEKKSRKARKSGITVDEHVSASLNNKTGIRLFNNGHYINCDLRYFNLLSLGKFDVVYVDPPWRISGAQMRDEKATLFSNNSFNLQYNTLSNEEIWDIDVGSLSNTGFLFLWVLNSNLQFALQLMNNWGYTYVDRIVWIKKNRNSDGIAVSHGFYFLHSTELCLVGVKYSNEQQKLQYISKVTNDVLFSRIGAQSQKPEAMYEIINAMLPGARKIELFANNHNIREGWLSLGNRLGPVFEQQLPELYTCCKCQQTIVLGIKRYKSKTTLNANICHGCFEKSELPASDYFIFDNVVEEAVFHDWIACDTCGQYPIYGNRFRHMQQNVDLCEACFDKTTISAEHNDSNTSIHQSSQYEALELPVHGAGYSVHARIRCNGCNSMPIIGERFECCECNNINLCRKCFFNEKEPKDHSCLHDMQIVLETNTRDTSIKCSECKQIVMFEIYACQHCANLILCKACHDDIVSQNGVVFKYKAPAHKSYHKFLKLK